MRHFALVVAAVLLPACFAQAQIGVGAKVGFNIATVSADPDIAGSKSSRMGILFGGVFEIGVGGPMYVAAEPMFSQKGVKQDGSIFVGGFGEPVSGTITTKVSELDIPILAKVKFLEGVVRPYAFVGPSIGFVLSAKENWEPIGYASQEVDIKDNTSSVDFGLVFGGGAEFHVARSIGLTADVRYSLGLSDMAKEPAGMLGDQKIRTRGFEALAGILFWL